MFNTFAALVKAQFQLMSQHELYVTEVDPEEVWAIYLASFPEGTNPMFRERTKHDCSACRNFIKHIGNVVAVIDGRVMTVWDVEGLPAPYDVVAKHLSVFVTTAPINGLFRAPESSYGITSNKEIRPDGSVHTWNHFHGAINAKHYDREPGAVVGKYATNVGVFKRGMEEITKEAAYMVADLVRENAIYRGAESAFVVGNFCGLHSKYAELSAIEKNVFLWTEVTQPGALIRNTAIGTLLKDLSAGVDIQEAVKAYEKVMAPENYKRPTALITPAMVKQAMAKIQELNLEPALERRHANIQDITINNVLWADNTVKPQMKGGVEGLLMAAAKPAAGNGFDEQAAADVTIEDFMANILLNARSIDMLVKNQHQGNFMSVTAPVHADVERLFKWDNNFGWSYDGNIADSAMKDRVKKAGGAIEGVLCCRLAWDYTDDLDLHMDEPSGSGVHFHVRNSTNGGHLDVDANGGNGMMPEPVENIVYATTNRMAEGTYQLRVNNYNRRSSAAGFDVEIEIAGQTLSIHYPKALRVGEYVAVATIKYSKKTGLEIIKSLPGTVGGGKSMDKWGIKTETAVKVNTIMHSPNHWDDNKSGNKHWFFILDGCKNDLPTRGIYNEFLKPELEQHRKVFEVLGDKTKCQPVPDQLSGLGFSSTKGDKVLVAVATEQSRKIYNILF